MATTDAAHWHNEYTEASRSKAALIAERDALVAALRKVTVVARLALGEKVSPALALAYGDDILEDCAGILAAADDALRPYPEGK